MPDADDENVVESGGEPDGVCFDPKIAEKALANDLNQMTVAERNTVLDDVHGVRKLLVEESHPSKILESLEQMNQALEKIEDKTAYNNAVALGSPYILQDRMFRIQFLRADEFDGAKAAQRFVNYLNFSFELFGAVALMRPIYFDDLTKDEQNVLREGAIQLLTCRDRTGRRILTRIGLQKGLDERQFSPSLMRINLYIMQVLASDEKSQQLGCVMIFHGGAMMNGDDEYIDEVKFLREPNIKENIRKFISAFPLRVSAIHICFPDLPPYRFAAAALSLIAPAILRVRVRVHLGSQTECRYSLMAYGIPADQLPLTSSGRIKTVNHQRWIKFQREKEDTIQMGLPPFEGVDCPLGMDILIGNAGNNSSYFKNNPGNLKYRELLELHYRNYEAASDTQEKTRITWKVLEELGIAGGRILVRDRRGWWAAASTTKAREKIAHDFRETRKKLGSTKKRRSPVEQQLNGNGAGTATPAVVGSAPSFLFVGEHREGTKKRRSNHHDSSSDDNDSSGAGCMRIFR